jgi:hypothetical protein
MYGLGKDEKKGFEFDLEKDLKNNPQKAKEIMKSAEAHVQELKGMLRGGSKGPEFDQLGTLLHGYTALQKVLSKLSNKK